MSSLRRALLGIAIGGLAFGLAMAPIVLSSNHVDKRGFYLALGLFVGWAFIGTGLFAWLRRPANRFGALMVAVGFAFLIKGLDASDSSWPWIVGQLLDNLAIVLFIQLLLEFPTGRLEGAREQAIAAGAWIVGIGLQIPPLLFFQTPDASECEGCPTNPILVHGNHNLAVHLFNVQELLAIAPVGGLAVLMVRRWRGTTPAQRTAFAPVLWTGGVTMALFVAQFLADLVGFSDAVVEPLDFAAIFTFAAMPFAFLIGLLRSRIWRSSAVNELVERLGQAPARGYRLRDSLADALEDPSLMLAYWLPELRRYVDDEGKAVELPGRGSGRRSVLVEREGEPVAAIVHDEALSDDPELIRTVGAALALALENERLDAALRARVEELRASRSRIVQAADAERRRLERDLHDGAQQHLVSLALNLRLARGKVESDPAAAAELLDETMAELTQATDELRELARGIHPAVLTDRGLAAALQALAGRAPMPVELLEIPEERLPAAVESAAYFVVAEALTNVVRYAQASRAEVTVERLNGRVIVEVRDDGVGGADPAEGSGLRGLGDRVAALDGRLDVTSPKGEGTRVRAEVPCAS
jgi:signal transduction histidine kinase